MKPTTKMTAAGLGGAAATLIVWALSFAVDVPGTVGAAIGTLCAFAAGYLVPEESDDEGQGLVWVLAVIGIVLLVLILLGDGRIGR